MKGCLSAWPVLIRALGSLASSLRMKSMHKEDVFLSKGRIRCQRREMLKREGVEKKYEEEERR